MANQTATEHKIQWPIHKYIMIYSFYIVKETCENMLNIIVYFSIDYKFYEVPKLWDVNIFSYLETQKLS